MRKILLYSTLGISILLLYISVAIFIINNKNEPISNTNRRNEIYTVYLDGEVSYKGPIELMEGTRLKDFIYDYLTKYSDYDSFDDNEIIKNYHLYRVGYISKLDINTATKKELMSLDGIGDVYSNSIIEGRPYNDILELKSKKIIGDALYASIKNKICC